MSGYRIGSGYLGSPDIEISVGEQEILPSGKTFYKFSFMNTDSPCHISINGGNWIYIGSSVGFNSDVEDMWIQSFKVKENSIRFFWLGAWK